MTFAAVLLYGLAAVCAAGPRPAVRRLSRVVSRVPRSDRHGTGAAGSVAVAHPDRPMRSASGPWPRALASAVAGLAVTLFVIAPAVVVAAPVVAATTWWLLGRAEPAARARERHRLEIAVPLAADLLAAAITAGCSVNTAMAVVGDALSGPAGLALARAAAAADVGSDAARVWAPLRAEASLVPLARALDAAATRGTSPVPALHRIAEDARLAARWAAQARARSSGARAAAPLGLCFLPAFVLLAVVPLVATSGAGLF